MADRRYHVAFLLVGVVLWTGENDTKTISVDANLFENGLVWTGPQPKIGRKIRIFILEKQCSLYIERALQLEIKMCTSKTVSGANVSMGNRRPSPCLLDIEVHLLIKDFDLWFCNDIQVLKIRNGSSSRPPERSCADISKDKK